MAPAPAHRRCGWRAHLELAFELRGARTVIARRQHVGPLVVQRPFYPAGDSACHVYLLHPPGGVVGADQLVLDAHVGAGAHALLTTPAATKLYRSARDTAVLHQRLRVEAGARLSWVPQETIAFRGADATTTTRIDLADGAECFAWEVACFGRSASGEVFDRGRWRQRFEVWRDDAPLVIERARYEPELLTAGHGLAGATVAGTAVFVHSRADALVALGRERLVVGESAHAAVTAVRGAVVARYHGDKVEAAHAWLRGLWVLSGEVTGRPRVPPRIWAT